MRRGVATCDDVMEVGNDTTDYNILTVYSHSVRIPLDIG